jgi:hypothetical protein
MWGSITFTQESVVALSIGFAACWQLTFEVKLLKVNFVQTLSPGAALSP